MDALILALAISIGANVLVGFAWIHARDARAAVAQQLAAAQADATTCSDKVEELSKLADKRGAEAKAAQAKARAAAASAGKRATQELTTLAAVPGDDYASVQARLQRWEKRRVQP